MITEHLFPRKQNICKHFAWLSLLQYRWACKSCKISFPLGRRKPLWPPCLSSCHPAHNCPTGNISFWHPLHFLLWQYFTLSVLQPLQIRSELHLNKCMKIGPSRKVRACVHTVCFCLHGSNLYKLTYQPVWCNQGSYPVLSIHLLSCTEDHSHTHSNDTTGLIAKVIPFIK
jgi:hypothetical protein